MYHKHDDLMRMMMEFDVDSVVVFTNKTHTRRGTEADSDEPQNDGQMRGYSFVVEKNVDRGGAAPGFCY